MTDDRALMTTFLKSEWVSTLSVLAVPKKETSSHETRSLLERPPSDIQSILVTLHWEVSGTGMKPEGSLGEWAWLLLEF